MGEQQGIRMHPRASIVSMASAELKMAFDELEDKIAKKHKLTENERLANVSSAFGDWLAFFARMGIRIERHGTTDKKGDEA